MHLHLLLCDDDGWQSTWREESKEMRRSSTFCILVWEKEDLRRDGLGRLYSIQKSTQYSLYFHLNLIYKDKFGSLHCPKHIFIPLCDVILVRWDVFNKIWDHLFINISITKSSVGLYQCSTQARTWQVWALHQKRENNRRDFVKIIRKRSFKVSFILGSCTTRAGIHFAVMSHLLQIILLITGLLAKR